MFVDGVLKATNTTAVFNACDGTLKIGGGGTADIDAWFDEVRFIKGSVPSLFETSSTTIDASIFTPPTSPYSRYE